MNYSAKKLLLLDGMGALVTATLLSQVLMRFQPVFGMPQNILLVLALIAFCFAIYSISCFFLVKAGHARFLTLIMVANIIYCITTAVLVLLNFQVLTGLGIAYFIGEIIIVSILVSIEYRKIKGASKQLNRNL